MQAIRCIRYGYFNPRSREGSDNCPEMPNKLIFISIHAPVKGAASMLSHSAASNLAFQSTLP